MVYEAKTLCIILLNFRLWGENFFNKKTKKWSTNKSTDNERAFNTYILDPIFKLFDAIMNFKVTTTFNYLKYWLKISFEFKSHTNLPTCLGSGLFQTRLPTEGDQYSHPKILASVVLGF